MHVFTVVSLLASLPLAFSQDSVVYVRSNWGAGDSTETPHQSYRSNTNVQPPEMFMNTKNNQPGLQSGYVFLGIDGEPDSGQDWPVIFEFSEDRMGSLVWTGNYSNPFNFKTQTYKDEPVLTFWSGEMKDGYGRGSFYILNQSYVEIANFEVSGFGDDMGDIHEFEITPNDSALVAIYHAIPWDLTAAGGIEDGWLFDNTFQDIDIETGELVFQWNASTHIGIEESYNDLPDDTGRDQDSPWDYFHINSIQKDRNGDYLVSARVMDCVYKISGDDGHIIWRLHGKHSDFDVEEAAHFAFQHDVRWLNDDQTRMTLFDNGPTENIGYSRGLLLDVNQDDMTVRLIQEFTNEAQTFAQYEGNLQAIDPSNETTNFFLGYGSEPFFTELDHEGNILLDVQYATTNKINSYRAFRQQWEGKPLTKPDMHWDQANNSAYFSWLGATDIESWVVYTANSSDSSSWTNVTEVRRTGFETTVYLSDVQLEDFLRAKAVDADGDVLGWTRASDGNQLYDVPDGVEESRTASMSSSSSTTSTMKSSSMTSSSEPSETSVDSTGAAARATQGVMEQVYVAAVVVVSGLALA